MAVPAWGVLEGWRPAALNKGWTYHDSITASESGQWLTAVMASRYSHSSAEQWEQRLLAGELRRDDGWLQADVVVDCAPLFEERYAMSDACVRLAKPMVECAMYETEAHVTSFAPGETGCLRCLYPEQPADWTRRFPVIGAVSGTAGCIGAMEVIKIVTGVGRPLFGRLLHCDLRSMAFHTVALKAREDCPICS